ncbi:MAG TPA: Tm-1-like ATP-binding domain-containing protein, partial [Planctomycetota bacterium]|nr:Tm-1-like ATP-binding domain-containing protein [Planctomycetota bacterium]
ESSFDCLVFHGTEMGRKSIVKLAESNLIAGQIDITTTQLAIFTPGMERKWTTYFDPAIKAGLPWVGSVGAMDMVNFGPPETVPAHLKHRLFYRHNALVTLMRTTRDENAAIGRWLGEQLNRFESPLRFLIPEKGVSAIDAVGQPFFDPEADAALFEGIEKTFQPTRKRKLIRLPLHINDPAFATAVVENFQAVAAVGAEK